MIITEKIRVKVISTTVEHYKALGYDVFQGNTFIEVPPHHLTEGSKIKIQVKCEVCGTERELEYKRYLANSRNGGYYACSSMCAKQKAINTNIKKYGVENPFQSEEIKEKMRQTNLKNLGCEFPSQSPEVREKVKETLMKNYGVENPMFSEEIKDTLKESMLEKYGVEHILQIPEKAEEIHRKLKEAMMEKYGVENSMQVQELKDKRKETYFKNYGVDHYAKSEESRILAGANAFSYLINKYSHLQFISKTHLTSTIKCDKGCDHNFEITTGLLYRRTEYKVTLCTICNDLSTSKKSIRELQVYDFTSSLLPDEEVISGYHFPKTNGKELDIYLPNLNLGFEFNGIYFHSDKFKKDDKHIEKTNFCKDKGIELTHIWEDDWVYKENIVKSLIKERLGLITNTINIDDCDVRLVDHIITREFLVANHIQGFCNSKIRLGLYHDDELVSLMTFGKRNNYIELLRFCNKIDTSIDGSVSNLLNHFVENYSNRFNSNEIVTYVDASIFPNNPYERLGFQFESLEPTYHWVVDDLRYHHLTFSKKVLTKRGYDTENKTIEEIIRKDLKGKKIWNCGMAKFVYKMKNPHI